MTKVVSAFVDAVEEGLTTLIVDGRTFHAPTSLLPEGTTEGQWLELRLTVIPRPAQAADLETRRRRLARDDNGGDFKL